VEHHEFGQLVAVLTRSLGVRRLDLVEDVVQAALVQALETCKEITTSFGAIQAMSRPAGRRTDPVARPGPTCGNEQWVYNGYTSEEVGPWRR
jgi:hypothetical protein